MASEAIRRARRLKQKSEDAQSEGHWKRAERLRELQWQAQRHCTPVQNRIDQGRYPA